MMIQYRRGCILLCLASITTVFAAASTIGVASTRGTMEVDGASVRGIANISDGTSVRTNESYGRIELQKGVQITLGQNSVASIYSNRVDLQQGTGRISAKSDYAVDALGFHVASSNGASAAKVQYEGANRILVTAVASGLQVSKDGVLLARLNPGTTYFFEPDQQDDPTAKTAGKTAGTNAGTTAAKVGLSTGAKWGIVAGLAAAGGTAAGLATALSGSSTSH